MKFLILSENSNGAWANLHTRSVGPRELKRVIEERNHTVSIIDWFTCWPIPTLQKYIAKYFEDTAFPIIAISTPFNPDDGLVIIPILKWAKKEYPTLKILWGGFTGEKVDNKSEIMNIADLYFIGRCMQVFTDWLDNKDLTRYIYENNPKVLFNAIINQQIECPVLPITDEDDFLTPNDILGFELSVGCKFNCSFCRYQIRGVKKTTSVDKNDLKEFFEIAYKKYGIQHFSNVDDTVNESNEKLEILVEAMSLLDFKPKISAMARLDLLAAKPEQLKLLEKIQFHSLFFGIESLNPVAAKLIRKKTGIDNVVETLRAIKKSSPNTYTAGGIIVGLTGDSKESIYNEANNIVREKLLSAMMFFPLILSPPIIPKYSTSMYWYSDIEKNPQQFGYEVWEKQGSTMAANWKNDWIDRDGAVELAAELADHVQASIGVLDHVCCLTATALGVDNFISGKLTRNMLTHRIKFVVSRLKREYVAKKMLSVGIK